MTLGRERRAAIPAFARRLLGLAVVDWEGEGGGDEFSAIGAIDRRHSFAPLAAAQFVVKYSAMLRQAGTLSVVRLLLRRVSPMAFHVFLRKHETEFSKRKFSAKPPILGNAHRATTQCR